MGSAHHIFSMHRVHRGHLSTRASPVTYMYVVSAKINFFPLNLSPSQSYYQHGHSGTSECWGMPDGVYYDNFLYLEGVILVDFGRKNKNTPPQEPTEVKSGGSMVTNTKKYAILGDLVCLNAYNGV
jgi:hypothetical protein